MQRDLGPLTTGGCGECKVVKKGLWRTGSKRHDWACLDCRRAKPEVEAKVQAFAAAWKQNVVSVEAQ